MPDKRCMFSRKRSPAILPCLPRSAQQPPKGPGWIHEIKHDGFRIIARRDAKGVRLFTRNGYDFTARFPKVVDAIASLPVRSCVVDGEAIVVDERGLSIFDELRYRLSDHAAVLCAFDLIELDGEDLRWARLEDRKDTLATLLRDAGDGIAFNKHFDGDGEIISARLLPGLRGYRVETTWFGLSLRPRQSLAQDQEPGGASRAARSGGGLERQAHDARGTKPPRDTDRGLVIGDDVAPLPAAMGYRRIRPQLFHRPRQQRAGVGLRVFRDRTRKAHGRQSAHAR